MNEDEFPKLKITDELHRKMVEIARQFRKKPTASEALLWQALRGKKMDGIKFRRQQPIGPFIVDFFAPAIRLVVELDGPIHENQKEADRQRQCMLEETGLTVLRLTADDVENNLPAVLHNISFAIQTMQSTSAPLLPLWERGGHRG